MIVLLSDPQVAAVPVRESGEALVAPRRLLRPRPRARTDGAGRAPGAGAGRPAARHRAPRGRGAPVRRRPARHHRGVLRRGLRRAPRHLARRPAPADQPVRRAGRRRPARRRRGRRPHPGRRLRRRARPRHADRRDPRAVATAPATSPRPASAPTPARTATCSPGVLSAAGLVNYPTEWWHWSYGDRYWALATGADRRALRPGPGSRPRRRRERARPPARRRARPPARLCRSTSRAVAANTRLFAARTAGELMAVVKADGFGHGARRRRPDRARARGDLARRHQHRRGAGRCATAGLRAPDAELAQPASTPTSPTRVRRRGRARRPGRASTSTRSSRQRPAPAPRVHLHLDTGMARDGAAPAAWARLCRAARRAEQRRAGARSSGVMGHLGCADDPARRRATTLGRTPASRGALETARAGGLRPAQRHLAATAATLTDPRTHHTMSRVGAGLVGIDPTGTTRAAARDDPDRAAGRQRPPRARRHARSATATPAPRPAAHPPRPAAARATPTACRGTPRDAPRCCSAVAAGPVVGRISMDQVVVDLGRRRRRARASPRRSSVPATPGEPTVAEWAAWAEHPRARDRHRHRPRGVVDRGHGRASPLRTPSRSVPAVPDPASPARRVAVIGGGQNCEHEVSLASAAAVAAALDPAAYDVVPLTIGRTAPGATRDRGPWGWPGGRPAPRPATWSFPVVHGPRGEDGTLAALCELAGVPYVGSGVGRRRAGDGQVGDQAGRRRARHRHRARRCWSPPRRRRDVRLRPTPVVVKPVAAGSSHGVTLVRDAADLGRGAGRRARARRPGPRRGRRGRAARSTSPCSAAPTVAGSSRRRWRSWWTGSSTTRRSTAAARTSASPLCWTRSSGRRSRRRHWPCTTRSAAPGSRGSTSSSPRRGRCSTRSTRCPGFTEQSQVPRMFAAAGLSYADLLDRLVRDVLSV